MCCRFSHVISLEYDTTAVATHREHFGVADGITRVAVDGIKVPVWEWERQRNVSTSIDAVFLSKTLASAAAHPVCARLSTELTLPPSLESVSVRSSEK